MKRRRKDIDRGPRGTPWHRSTFALALAGGLALFAAFPPVGFWPLVWVVAVVCWLVLVQRRELPGRRPMLAIWLASSIHWLLMLEGVRKAHVANNLGWVALSLYLGIYLPCFVSLTRVAVHQLRISLILAAPVVWAGLELARGYLITGFSLSLLGHALFEHPLMIQTADLFGAYAVGFWVMLVAACLTCIGQIGRSPRALAPAFTLIIVSGAVIVYGYIRLSSLSPSNDDQELKVALIQHSVDKKFVADPQKSLNTFKLYRDLTLEARDQHPDLDLIVWPESVFTGDLPELFCAGEFILPPDATVSLQQAKQQFEQMAAHFRVKARGTAERINQTWSYGEFRQLDIFLLVGCSAVDIGDGEQKDYNSALLIHPEGRILDRYFKMHPVMFGEYLPFGEVFPWIYRLTPMRGGLARGAGPSAFEVKGLKLSPSICFESTVPHLIRRQVRSLKRAGQAPDVLVNVTDDGWFWGASILDQQLACAVFRAVELRRPFLVAANTGISAWIDGNGSIRERGPRRDKRIVIALVSPDNRQSLYEFWGDLPSATCLGACLLLAVWGLLGKWRSRRENAKSASGGEKGER